MNSQFFKAMLAGLAFLAGLGSAQGAAVKNVDCDAGQSIQKAVDSAVGYGGNLELRVSGYCEQNVVIRRDVVIQGINGAQISGQVTISGAWNVDLSDLTITGPGNGLVSNSGQVTLRSVDLIGNAGSAVIARRNSTVRAIRCQIVGNLIESEGGNAVALHASVGSFRQTDVVDNHGWGINAFNRSQVDFTNGAISRNSGPGLHVIDGSQLQISDSEVADNEAMGIVVRLNSNSWIQNTSIHGNHQEGLAVNDVSSARVFDTAISENVENGIGVATHAFLYLLNSNVAGNGGDGLFLNRDSGAEIDGETQIPANGSGWAIVCGGKESSFDIGSDALIGPVSCDDPEF